jgi:hypothetical protein
MKAIYHQPDANISYITNEVCIKVVECLPSLTVGWVHHDSIVLMYTFFVSRCDRKVIKLLMCSFCYHLLVVLIHNFDKTQFNTL